MKIGVAAAIPIFIALTKQVSAKRKKKENGE
ncbi:hypothetical protein J2Y02_000580 [Neobacillus drentensis]|nr:hypothetical protein [Neobacillus drentensis]